MMLNKKFIHVYVLFAIAGHLHGMERQSQHPSREVGVFFGLPNEYSTDAQDLPTAMDSCCNCIGQWLPCSCCINTRLTMAEFIFMRELNVRLQLAQTDTQREEIGQELQHIGASYARNQQINQAGCFPASVAMIPIVLSCLSLRR